MKRCVVAVAAAVLTLCMGVLMAGCATEGELPALKNPQLSGADLVTEGELTVGVDTTNPPLAGQSNGIIGIDVDIAAALADELGLKLTIVDTVGKYESALKDGKIDIAMGVLQDGVAEASGGSDGDGTDDSAADNADGMDGNGYSDEAADEEAADEEAAVWCSDVYLPTAVALFAASPDATIPTKDSEPVIAVQASSMSSWLVTEKYGASAVSIEEGMNTAFEKLVNGTAQYVAADAVIGGYVAKTVGAGTNIIALLEQPTGYRLAGLSSKSAVKQAVSTALATIMQNGIVDVVQKKWMGASMDFTGKTIVATVEDDSEEDSGE